MVCGGSCTQHALHSAILADPLKEVEPADFSRDMFISRRKAAASVVFSRFDRNGLSRKAPGVPSYAEPSAAWASKAFRCTGSCHVSVNAAGKTYGSSQNLRPALWILWLQLGILCLKIHWHIDDGSALHIEYHQGVWDEASSLTTPG